MTKGLVVCGGAKKEEFGLLNMSKTLNDALNKDSAGDIGMIHPGNYTVVPQGTKK